MELRLPFSAAKGPVAVSDESSIVTAVYAVVTAVLVLTGDLSEMESLSDEDVSRLDEEAKVVMEADAAMVEVNSVEDSLVPMAEASEVGFALVVKLAIETELLVGSDEVAAAVSHVGNFLTCVMGLFAMRRIRISDD